MCFSELAISWRERGFHTSVTNVEPSSCGNDSKKRQDTHSRIQQRVGLPFLLIYPSWRKSFSTEMFSFMAKLSNPWNPLPSSSWDTCKISQFPLLNDQGPISRWKWRYSVTEQRSLKSVRLLQVRTLTFSPHFCLVLYRCKPNSIKVGST